MTEETLPNALEAVADAPQAPETTEAQATDKPEGDKPEGKDENPLEKQLKREQRRIQNLTRQKYELQARLEQLSSLAPSTQKADNQGIDDDSDTLSLSKAELQRMIEQKAKELAPTIKAQEDSQAELRNKALTLRQELGERFDELTNDLAAVFDHDLQMMVLRAKAPKAVLEYLTDPDNAEVAERIARLDKQSAVFELGQLAAEISNKKVETRPQISKVAAPIEPVRGGGGASNAAPDVIKDPAGWRRWMNAQGL